VISGDFQHKNWGVLAVKLEFGGNYFLVWFGKPCVQDDYIF
jgi:hypothetical protein